MFIPWYFMEPGMTDEYNLKRIGLLVIVVCFIAWSLQGLVCFYRNDFELKDSFVSSQT